MENGVLVGVLYIWLMMVIISVAIIKTWVENQFFYVREKKQPNRKPYLEFFGEIVIVLTIIIPILILFLK